MPRRCTGKTFRYPLRVVWQDADGKTPPHRKVFVWPAACNFEADYLRGRGFAVWIERREGDEWRWIERA